MFYKIEYKIQKEHKKYHNLLVSNIGLLLIVPPQNVSE